MNGAGLPLDQKLRSFIAEYNNRILLGRGDQQPVSYRILESFVQPGFPELILEMLPETNLLVDANVLMDHLTEPNTPAGNTIPNSLVEDGRIYHINLRGGHMDMSLFDRDIRFHGASIVKHGAEISIMGLSSIVKTQTNEPKVRIDKDKIHPAKEFLTNLRDEIDTNDEDFFDDTNRQPLIYLMNYDLERETILSRYILHEQKDTFDIATDSLETYIELRKAFNFDSQRLSEHFDAASQVLKLNEAAFVLLSQIPQSMKFLLDHDEIRLSRQPTDLFINKNESIVRKINKEQFPQARKYAELRTILASSPAANEYIMEPLPLKIESGGYWKKLSMGSSGAGKNGEEVYGRTWVTVTESWSEIVGSNPSELPAKAVVQIKDQNDNQGIVYIMRNSSHKRNIFKVGFTTIDSESRAKGLDSASGVIDHFNVVIDWKVKRPRIVEQEVHLRLQNYRITKRREFFLVELKIIRETIETVISEMNAAIPQPT